MKTVFCLMYFYVGYIIKREKLYLVCFLFIFGSNGFSNWIPAILVFGNLEKSCCEMLASFIKKYYIMYIIVFLIKNYNAVSDCF